MILFALPFAGVGVFMSGLTWVKWRQASAARDWHEVQATTGQQFGFKLPDEFVYNSTLPCLAIQVVREHLGRPPFGYARWGISHERVHYFPTALRDARAYRPIGGARSG